MSRYIELPFGYQPNVGATVTISVTGKVTAVKLDPMAPDGEQIIVELQLGGEPKKDLFSKGPSKWDVPVQTSGFGGTT